MTFEEWRLQHEAHRAELNRLYATHADEAAFRAFNLRDIAFGKEVCWFYRAGDRGYVVAGPRQEARARVHLVVKDQSRFQESSVEVTDPFAPVPAAVTADEWTIAVRAWWHLQTWICGGEMPEGISFDEARMPWQDVDA